MTVRAVSQGRWAESRFNKSTYVSLTLVTVIVGSQDLFGLDLVIHRLHEVAGIVGSDDVLFGCRDDLA